MMKLACLRMVACASVVVVIGMAGASRGVASGQTASRGQSAGGGQAASASGGAPLLAEQAFKNIQALKGISAADFMGTMGIMTAALGFDCSECHVAAGTDKVDWAADTPRKVIARRMVNMVTTINQTNFSGRQMVTCWTCHRGRDKPVVTPTIDIVYGMPVIEPDDLVPASVPGLPKADEIVDKYLQAIGGTARLGAITSFTATGTSVGFGGFGGGGAVQIYAKAPDQRSTIIEFQQATKRDASIRSFDGKTGWIKTPLTVLGEYQVSGNELEGARLDAELQFPGQIKRVVTNLRTLQPATVNEHEMDVVQGNGPGRLFVTLYFDAQTHLLTRLIRYSSSPIGRMPTQVDFGDYRDVNGIKMPFRFTFAWLDGRDAFQLNDVKVNVPIDAARFGRPTSLETKR